MYAAHDAYWDIRHNRSVRIASPVGQAQFMLTGYLHMMDASPKAWMLLRRFADTIQVCDGEPELRDLRRLAEHLKKSGTDPRTAIAVEKEIVLRSSPYYAEGLAHDITPAARMLKDYEEKSPVFSQAERNLLLRYAYFTGDISGTERIAGRIAAHDFQTKDIAAVCAAIEAADLAWSGLESAEGIEVSAAEVPSSQFSFEDCENPSKVYPRFALYPQTVPDSAVLLQNGVILTACPEDQELWQSGLMRIDQTYVQPRYYIQTGPISYEMADIVEQDMDQSNSREAPSRSSSAFEQIM